MPAPRNEPKSAAAVERWLDRSRRREDRFGAVAGSYAAHRRAHGCFDVYPFENGALLGALAAAAHARRIVEVGCGLGYSALWLAYGAGSNAAVETIEKDAAHAAIARRHFKAARLARRINILLGRGAAVLPKLKPGYDLAYFDTDPAESLGDLAEFGRLLKPGGLLISTNLFLGQHAPNLPGLDRAAAYRVRILDEKRWRTGYLPDGTAVSVKNF
jgi:predicted O-methyltransferase YrrM